jgi:hypothetical protein
MFVCMYLGKGWAITFHSTYTDVTAYTDNVGRQLKTPHTRDVYKYNYIHLINNTQETFDNILHNCTKEDIANRITGNSLLHRPVNRRQKLYLIIYKIGLYLASRTIYIRFYIQTLSVHLIYF